MNIAICEDEGQARGQLQGQLKDLLADRRLEGQVVAFATAQETLQAMQRQAFDIFFLDIYMSGMSGVELARRIQASKPDAPLVFVTNSPDFMAEGFLVGAVHYLVKPYSLSDLAVALDRCLRLVGHSQPYVEIRSNRMRRRILYRDLIFIETQSRTLALHTRRGDFVTYGRLSDFMDQLHDARFLRCHRSYAVNLDYVDHVKGYDFVLTDGALVPIRREARAAMKAAFEDHCFSRFRADP